MKGIAKALAIVAAGVTAATAASAEEALDGYWMDSDGEVIIELGRCGDARCGKVYWLKQPFGPDGLALRDYRNSDPALQKRFVCGMTVVKGFKKQADGSWGDGTVYVSDLGTSYSGQAEVLSSKQVKVTGYVGIPFFGESEVWTKVARPPARCSTQQTSDATSSNPSGSADPKK